MFKTFVLTTLTVLLSLSSLKAQDIEILLPQLDTFANADTICVDVRATNIVDLYGIQFSLEWDSSVLDFINVEYGDLPNLSTFNFGLNDTPFGSLHFSWSVFSSPANLPDSSLLFSICFEVVGNAGESSNLDFTTDSPNDLQPEATVNFPPTLADLITDGGQVNIVGQQFLDLLIDHETVEANEAFGLPVRSNLFDSLNNLMTTISWDDALLQFDSVGAFGLPGLDQNSFDLSQVANGNLGLNWTSPNDSLISVPDNAPLFVIYFTATGPSGSVIPVTFSDTIFSLKVLDKNGLPVSIDTFPGEVKILTPLTLCSDTLTVFQSDTFCVPITAYDFDIIQSLQYTHTWDPDLLQFVGFNNINLPFLEPADFTIFPASLGTITLSWFDDMNQTSVTLPDSTVLYELCFIAIGPIGDSAVIDFEATPTPIEVRDSFGNVLDVVLKEPLIFIESAIKITDTLFAAPNCYFPDSGRIDITVSGGTPPYDFLWENGVTQEDGFGLEAGKVFVTITDAANNTHTLVAEFTLPANQMPPDAEILEDSIEVSCDILPFTLNGMGSMGPNYFYRWSTSNGQLVDTLADEISTQIESPGLYFFSVIDSTNGCGNFDSVRVTGDLDFPLVNAGPDKFLTCDSQTVTLSAEGSETGPNLIYYWQTGGGNIVGPDTSFNIVVDQPGFYRLFVQDTVSECQSNDLVLVEENVLAPIANAGPDRTFGCNVDDLQINSIADTVVGDQLEWSTQNGDLDLSTINSPQLTVFGPGIYQLVVTNSSNGCSDTSEMEVILDTLKPDVSLGTQTFIDCITGLGNIEIVADPDSPYVFKWSALDGGILIGDDNKKAISVGKPGLYQVSATDTTNGCRTILQAVVDDSPNKPEILLPEDTFLTCVVDTITLVPEVITFLDNPFTFSWFTTNGGQFIDGTNTLMPRLASPGTYWLAVFDTITECVDTFAVNVSYDTVPPVADAGVDQELTCISLSAIIGGSGTPAQGVQYLWSTDDGNFTSNPTFRFVSVNKAATYFLVVADSSSGCIGFDSVVVTQADDIPISDPGVDTVLTCRDTAIVLGGPDTEMGPNLTYLWSTVNGNVLTGEDSTFALVNAPGQYTLVVTNLSNNCFGFETVTVSLDTVRPTAEAGDTAFIDCNQPQDFLEGFGSTAGNFVVYDWSYQDGSDQGIVSGDSTLQLEINEGGTYFLTVTNLFNGCSATDSTFVEADTVFPEVVLNSSGGFDCTQNSALLDGTGSSTGTDFTFNWSPTTGLSDPNSLVTTANVPDLYILTIESLTNGCTVSDSVLFVYDTVPPEIVFQDLPTITCAEPVVTVDASGTTPDTNILIQWVEFSANIQSGQTTLEPLVDQPGVLQLIVTDTTNGCMDMRNVEIAIDTTSPVVDAGADFDMGCSLEPFDLSAVLTFPVSNPAIEWQSTGGSIVSGVNQLDAQGEGPGLYEVFVTDLDNGCSGSDELTVTQMENLSTAMTGEDFGACPDDVVTVSANLPAGNSGSWSSLTGAQLDAPDQPMSLVNGGLLPGSNLFVWSLSTDNCPDYDADTLVVEVAFPPQANNDAFTLSFNSSNVTLDVVANDGLPALGWEVSVLDIPALGGLENGGNGQFTYLPPAFFSGMDIFTYVLCAEDCPGLCDTAQVTINIEEPGDFNIDSLELPNAITPNEDGANDILFFDFLRIYGDRFPNNQMVIFNRWGDVILEEQPYGNDWDGRDGNGNDLPEGTYYYILRLSVPDGEVIKGDVTILR